MRKHLWLSLAAFVALALVAGPHVSAQYAARLPATAPFSPTYAFTSSGVLSIMPTGGSIQRFGITIGAGASSANSDRTVINADYVDVRFLGFNGNGNGGTNCPPDRTWCNSVWLTTSKLSATSLRVTANRGNIGDGTPSTVVVVEVMDLTTSLVDSVQRSTLTSAAAWTPIACPTSGNWAISWLGINGTSGAGGSGINGYLNRSGNTVVSTNGDTVTTAAQLICWH